MQVNPNKCHLAVNESCRKEIKIAGNIKKNSECVNLALKHMWKIYARELVVRCMY